MYRLLTIIPVLVALLVSVVHAEDLAFTGVLSTRVWSRYIGFHGVEVSKKPVLWTDTLVCSTLGTLCLDVRHSVGLDGTSPNSDFGDEIDYSLWYSKKFGGVGFSAGLSYFDLYKLFGKPSGDLLQPFAEVNYTLTAGAHTFVPSLRLEYTTPIPGTNSARVDNVSVFAGTSHSWTFDSRWSLNQTMTFLYNSGGGGISAAGIAKYQGGLLWKPSNRVSIELLTVRLFTPLFLIEETGKNGRKFEDRRKFEAIFGAGVVIKLF